MFSQDGAHPQDAAAAGPTNEGAAVTQPCTNSDCQNLNSCVREANSKQRARDELTDEVQAYLFQSSEEIRCLEDAITMYLPARLSQLPNDQQDKFFSWKRDDGKLTPREEMNYRQAVNAARLVKTSHAMTLGMTFLKDLARGDFDVMENLSTTVYEDIQCLNDAISGVEWNCDNSACEENRKSAETILNKFKTLDCVSKRKTNQTNAVKALNYGLALLKKMYSEDLDLNGFPKMPVVLSTGERDPIYKRAVNLVRRLHWKEGLPSAVVGCEFHERVANMRIDMVPKPDQCRTLQEQRRRLTITRVMMKLEDKEQAYYNYETDFNHIEKVKVKDVLEWVKEEVAILDNDPRVPPEEEQQRLLQEETRVEYELTEGVKNLQREFCGATHRQVLLLESLQLLDQLGPYWDKNYTRYFNDVNRLHHKYLDLSPQHGQPQIVEMSVDRFKQIADQYTSKSTKPSSTSGKSTIPSKTRADDDPNKSGSSNTQ